jgi:hypothetical protein
VQILPIDVVSLVAVFMVFSIILIPVIGVTARFALKPTVEALSRFFDHKGLDESVHILERRMALIEQQIEAMESSVRRLAEVSEFHHALEEGGPESGAARNVRPELEAGRPGREGGEEGA